MSPTARSSAAASRACRPTTATSSGSTGSATCSSPWLTTMAGWSATPGSNGTTRTTASAGTRRSGSSIRTGARRGIGARFLTWSEQRRIEIAARARRGGRGHGPGLGRSRPSSSTAIVGGRDLLDRAGYVPFRRFASMQSTAPRRPPGAPPARRTGDPADPARDGRDSARCSTPTSRRSATTSAGARAPTRRFAAFLEEPETDPDLWLVAFDGAEVAGAVLNGIHVSPDGEQIGLARLDLHPPAVAPARPGPGADRPEPRPAPRSRPDGRRRSESISPTRTRPSPSTSRAGSASVSSSTAYRKPLPASPPASPQTQVEEVPR